MRIIVLFCLFLSMNLNADILTELKGRCAERKEDDICRFAKKYETAAEFVCSKEQRENCNILSRMAYMRNDIDNALKYAIQGCEYGEENLCLAKESMQEIKLNAYNSKRKTGEAKMTSYKKSAEQETASFDLKDTEVKEKLALKCPRTNEVHYFSKLNQASLSDILKSSRAWPYRNKEGNVAGFELSDIQESSPYHHLGLNNGDIILEFNNEPMTTPAKAMDLIGAIYNVEPEFCISFNRKGNIHKWTMKKSNLSGK